MLSEQMKAEGWIEHDGGECPVLGPILIMYRDGVEAKAPEPLNLAWKHDGHYRGSYLDIIAYKVVSHD